MIKPETVSTTVAIKPFCSLFFARDLFAEDLLSPVFFPEADEDRPFAVELLLLAADVLEPLMVFEPLARVEDDLEELALVVADDRPDLDLDADVVPARDCEVAFLDFDEDDEPFAFEELADFDLEAALADRPVFEVLPLDEEDFEPDVFEPAPARLEAPRLEEVLLDREVLFDPDDFADEPLLEVEDFFPLFDAVGFFEPDDDFDVEDFFEEEDDFDPEDFFVAAITLIPRSSFDKTSAAIRSTN